jgi:imidazole glycerol-phosphate synthase subunit HisH
MIAIVDYGIGNLASIKNMLRKIGEDAVIASSEQELAKATKIIFPGFGAFDSCSDKLTKSGLIPLLTQKIIVNKTPVLGICVGMQLLFNSSEEGQLSGLNWIEGKNVKFRKDKMPANYKIPHMGWADVRVCKSSAITDGLEADSRFYFGHSYHAQLEDESDALITVDYGYRYVAAVARGNIFGVQFHPEKSHRFGMQLLGNFVKAF